MRIRVLFETLPKRWLFFCILAGIVLWSVLGHGLPALRHDWRFPFSPSALLQVIANYTYGWVAAGLGQPQPDPTFYYLSAMLWPFTLVTKSSVATVALLLFATVCLCASSAWRISKNAQSSNLAAGAVASFAVLNPWVYSKYVAGHVYMVLTYGIVLAIVAELTAQRQRRYRLLLFSALLITQLQFFLLIAPILAFWAIRHREWKVISVLIASAMPIVVGVLGTLDALRRTPFFLPWQESQSVPLNQGVQLLGYAFAYADAFHFVAPALLAIVCLCLWGALRLRDTFASTIVMLGATCLLLASGTRGPLSSVYRVLVLHFTAIGVFRELYDLIAITAVAYVILLSCALRGHRARSYAAWAAVLLLVIPWFQRPAFTFFVPAAEIPRLTFPTHANSRIALLPAFQPMAYHETGSGYDPDSYEQPGRAIPLNQFYPEYPVDYALGLASITGDYTELGALGVGTVYLRPYLQSNREALRYQLVGVPVAAVRHVGVVRVPAHPLAIVAPGMPKWSSMGYRPTDFDRFFGDAAANDPESVRRAALSIVRFEPDKATIDPRRSWIDLRLAAVAKPFLANPFGGVYTENGRRTLDVPKRTSLLAWTSGRIVDANGRVVADKAGELKWFTLRGFHPPLRCNGACAVILAANVPEKLGDRFGPPSNEKAIAAKALTPWLYVFRLPPYASGTLQFSERFSRYWLAGFPLGLPHFRIDGIFNGWSVTNSGSSAKTIFAVQYIALFQAVLEGLAILLLAALLAGEFRLRDRGNH